jgi:hypothetical protein
MLARRLPSILPPLSFEEALEATKRYSIAARGPAPAAVRFAAKTRLPRLPAGQAPLVRRPFRAPHHSISDAGLIGGGSIPRPGQVSLAHHGVLFLDGRPSSATPWSPSASPWRRHRYPRSCHRHPYVRCPLHSRECDAAGTSIREDASYVSGSHLQA